MPSFSAAFIALALAAFTVAAPILDSLPVDLDAVGLDGLPIPAVPTLDGLPITGLVDTVKGLIGSVSVPVAVPVRRDLVDVDLEDLDLDLDVDVLKKRIPDLPTVLASLRLDTNKASEAITGELANDNPDVNVIAQQLGGINTLLFSFLGEVPLVAGLGLPISASPDGAVTLSNEEIATQLGGVLDTITGIVTRIQTQLGNDVEVLRVPFGLLDATVALVLKTVGGLVPELLTLLAPVLDVANPILEDLGVGIGLGVIGL